MPSPNQQLSAAESRRQRLLFAEKCNPLIEIDEIELGIAVICTSKIHASARGEYVPESDLARLASWAATAQGMATMLSLVLRGDIEAFVQDGEVMFGEPEKAHA